MNQLYIFPRNSNAYNSSTGSSESEEDLPVSYNLKLQNQISRKNQTFIKEEKRQSKHNMNHSMNAMMEEYHSTKSVKSAQSVE